MLRHCIRLSDEWPQFAAGLKAGAGRMRIRSTSREQLAAPVQDLRELDMSACWSLSARVFLGPLRCLPRLEHVRVPSFLVDKMHEALGAHVSES